MADKPDVSAAIADALAAKNAAADASKDEGTGAKLEATPVKTDAKPASTGADNEVKTEGKEVPSSLFGVDLSVLPDDATREKFISEFMETNKTIGKLQRENADLRKAPEPTPAPAPVAEAVDVSKLTDEQIAAALGINPAEADERDMREIALTRSLLEQADRLERLEKGVTQDSRSRAWDKSFDALERQFGVLPEDTSREEVFAWAAEQGIASAEAAYWAAVGPVRAAVSQALSKQIVELKTTSKKGATTLRPATSADVDEARLTSTNVKDAIKEAFEKSRAELGIGDQF